MAQNKIDPYQILGVEQNASYQEIKFAYRELVKQHHPDAGGDEKTILALNAAWEILGDLDNRKEFDIKQGIDKSLSKEKENRNLRNDNESSKIRNFEFKGAKEELEFSNWIKFIYIPIDKLIGEIINPLKSQIKSLSADPYDDLLMEEFCSYILKSKNKIKKIHDIYKKRSTPPSANELSLNLYHCFSLIEDGLNELELYTNGYVDNYLHDGNAMFKEAKKKRSEFKIKRKNLPSF
tara:strand:+ start:2081 stop:2788 length:708 start_codon:yes stop_codon:yes gene_type:complete